MTENIHHIVFDLGNVLTPVERHRAYDELLPYLPKDKARLLKEDVRAFESLIAEPAIALECGKISFEDFQETVKATLGLQSSDLDFRRAYSDIFSLDKRMVELGAALSQRYGAWLASNTSEAHFTWILEHFPETAFYRSAALSYKLGVMKPSAEYFRKAINLFGINPKQSVFIDDLEENVVAAINMGMRGIVFTGHAALVPELERLGVDIPNKGRTT